MRTAFKAEEPIESIGFFTRTSGSREPPAGKPALVLRTTQRIVELNRDHGVTRSFTMPVESRTASLAFWYPLEDGQALAEFHEPWRTEREENIAPVTLYRIAADGTIRSQTEVPLRSGMLIWSKQKESSLLVAALPAPLVLPIAEWFFVTLINQAPSFSAAVRMMIESSWPSLLAVAILGLLLSIASWRRSRAFGLPLPHQAVWAIFVFLFGMPGYAGYRLHRRWAAARSAQIVMRGHLAIAKRARRAALPSRPRHRRASRSSPERNRHLVEVKRQWSWRSSSKSSVKCDYSPRWRSRFTAFT